MRNQKPKRQTQVGPNDLAYFMICVVDATGQQDVFRPGLWYVKLTVDAGYGERIICAN